MPRRERNEPPPPPGAPEVPHHEHAPRPVKKTRWAWAKWLGRGIVLGIAGYEGLRFWKKIKGVKEEGDVEGNPRPASMPAFMPPQVIPLPIPVPQFMPVNMAPFGPPPPLTNPLDDDTEDELARLKAKRKRKIAQRKEIIMAAFEEDDD